MVFEFVVLTSIGLLDAYEIFAMVPSTVVDLGIMRPEANNLVGPLRYFCHTNVWGA